MYAHLFLEIQRYHSPGVHGNKRLKQWISCVHWGKMPMFLQHDNAITHTSDATSAVIESIRFLNMFHNLTTAWNWFHLTTGYLLLSYNVSKEFISYVMKYQQLQGYGFKKCLKSSTASCWKMSFFLQLRCIEVWRLNGKVRCRNEVHILNSILCFVSFQYLVQE